MLTTSQAGIVNEYVTESETFSLKKLSLMIYIRTLQGSAPQVVSICLYAELAFVDFRNLAKCRPARRLSGHSQRIRKTGRIHQVAIEEAVFNGDTRYRFYVCAKDLVVVGFYVSQGDVATALDLQAFAVDHVPIIRAIVVDLASSDGNILIGVDEYSGNVVVDEFTVFDRHTTA